MDPITLAVLALSGVVILGGGKKRRRVPSGVRAVMGEEDRRYWLNEIRNMSNWVSNQYGTMPYLGDFLIITSFRGSRFNPAMVNPEISRDSNAARGLFDMRPETAGQGALMFVLDNPGVLNDPYIAFVAAIDHIIRGTNRIFAKRSGNPDWLALRRWWAWPHLVHDFDESDSRSADVRRRLEAAIFDCNSTYGTDIDPDFIWMPIDLGSAPPSADELLQAFSGAAKAA